MWIKSKLVDGCGDIVGDVVINSDNISSFCERDPAGCFVAVGEHSYTIDCPAADLHKVLDPRNEHTIELEKEVNV